MTTAYDALAPGEGGGRRRPRLLGLGPARLGLLDAQSVVAYRLALPHIAPWVDMLAAPARAALVRQTLVAVGPHVQGWRPAAILLAGRVRPQPSRRPASRSSAAE
ncbi:MAG: hypothetical protein ACRDTX_02375 [Pseudonocardiaceae bacterium]